jgi:sensor histidine kinase regulating citrate/malate metabolism
MYRNVQNSTIFLIFCIIFQTTISLVMHGLNYLTEYGFINMFIPSVYNIIVIITALISLWSIRRIFELSEAKKEAEINLLKLKESDETILALRTQRHDFINHLQVIQGLLQLEHYDRIREYIGELTERVAPIYIPFQLHLPEATATIMKKIPLAQKAGIEMELHIESSLEHLSISGVDLASILTNLIDNAIEALREVVIADKRINIYIDETDQEYVIEVENNLPIIPPEVQNNIFKEGFSTKAKTGRGLGLSIVKKLAERNGGRIEVQSREGMGTIFTLHFPKI